MWTLKPTTGGFAGSALYFAQSAASACRLAKSRGIVLEAKVGVFYYGFIALSCFAHGITLESEHLAAEYIPSNSYTCRYRRSMAPRACTRFHFPLQEL